jgi:hypothetical protein
MIYPNMTEESRLLEDLLADAHARIRELQSYRDRLADELVKLQVNDRRRPVGSHSNIPNERRFAHRLGT